MSKKKAQKPDPKKHKDIVVPDEDIKNDKESGSFLESIKKASSARKRVNK